jgi:hypothetical protein
MLPLICKSCTRQHRRAFHEAELTCYSYGHSLVEFDPKAEAKLRLKIDLYIIPTVALLYLFCFIDRANIGMLISL